MNKNSVSNNFDKKFLFKPGDLVTLHSSNPLNEKWFGTVIDVQFRSKIVQESKTNKEIWTNAFFPKIQKNKKWIHDSTFYNIIYVSVLGKKIYNAKNNPLVYFVFLESNLKKI